MVANRALSPSSKLAIEEWAAEDVFLGTEEDLQVQHFYRAMDFLLQHAEDIQKEVFWSTASLLNLTVISSFSIRPTPTLRSMNQGRQNLRHMANPKKKEMICRW